MLPMTSAYHRIVRGVACGGIDITDVNQCVLDHDIHRDDKFRQYTLLRDLDRILKDADDHIVEIPYQTYSIVEVLPAVFVE